MRTEKYQVALDGRAMDRRSRADNLMKVGAIARQAGVLPSKIRYYVKEGLIEPAGQTPGGFLLFEKGAALRRLQLIDRLQREERLTVAEIRQRLTGDAEGVPRDQ